MKYEKVFVDSIGYELGSVVVSSAELEDQLKPMYDALHLAPGHLESLTGISERRWWEEGASLSEGAAAAAKKAMADSGVKAADLDVLIYAGVCREQFEPATACKVAAKLGVEGASSVYDISNACLGVLNGMLDVANRIELGQIKAGLVVSCESSREINRIMIDRMVEEKSIELFKTSLATLTGGSGAIAVLLTDGSFSSEKRHRLVGGVNYTAPQFHDLCTWGLEKKIPNSIREYMSTDSVSVLQYGVELGLKTWQAFLGKVAWSAEQVDKVICHQVGSGHQTSILKTLGISEGRDFVTYPSLGNIGTVSLLLTAAVAEERGFLNKGDKVGFLGIGSGLNCMMLGLEW